MPKKYFSFHVKSVTREKIEGKKQSSSQILHHDANAVRGGKKGKIVPTRTHKNPIFFFISQWMNRVIIQTVTQEQQEAKSTSRES